VGNRIIPAFMPVIFFFKLSVLGLLGLGGERMEYIPSDIAIGGSPKHCWPGRSSADPVPAASADPMQIILFLCSFWRLGQ
jgi:hypothetical protein